MCLGVNLPETLARVAISLRCYAEQISLRKLKDDLPENLDLPENAETGLSQNGDDSWICLSILRQLIQPNLMRVQTKVWPQTLGTGIFSNLMIELCWSLHLPGSCDPTGGRKRRFGTRYQCFCGRNFQGDQ